MFERKQFDALTMPMSIVAVLLSLTSGAVAAEVPPINDAQVANSNYTPSFTFGQIAPIVVTSEEHLTTTKNGVKFDVYFNRGPKYDAAIYAINTGRKQLVLTAERHRTILDDLIRRKFTVIVADFKDKKISGLELEKYVVQLTADAREAADGVLDRTARLRRPENPIVPPVTSKTETFAVDYFTLMPGFTIERDVTWFRYGDIPEAFRKEIARQLEKPFNEADAAATNTYDIIYPVYGPDVGVLSNYGSNEKGREDYYPLATKYLVMAFAFKNLAIVHQQYFNDPIGGYPKGYGFYGDQFAVAFMRHLKGNARRYHLDPGKICCFGHSKGSELPGMLVNKLRSTPRFRHGKADFKKIALDERDKTIRSPVSDLSTEIACAILGAGVANNEMRSDKMLPWDDKPAENISPFFLFADHVELMRQRTREVVSKAEAHGVAVETAELSSHTWPTGHAYDRASQFADKILRPDY